MIPRFRHILIPLDFTENNLAALNIAFDLAAVNHAVTTMLVRRGNQWLWRAPHRCLKVG